MDIYKKIEFGKYKDRFLIDLWVGKYQELKIENIRDYINNCIDFFFNCVDLNDMILYNGYNFNDKDISFLTFLNQNSNLRNSIQISSNKITINDLIISQDLSNFLIRFFNYSHFSNPSLNALKYPDNNPEEILLTKESQVIADSLPDPKYITWCMNNVDSFNLSESDYLDLKKLNSIYPSIILTKTEENKIEFKLLAYIQYHS